MIRSRKIKIPMMILHMLPDEVKEVDQEVIAESPIDSELNKKDTPPEDLEHKGELSDSNSVDSIQSTDEGRSIE